MANRSLEATATGRASAQRSASQYRQRTQGIKMPRFVRTVPIDVWRLSPDLDDRRQRLLDAVTPPALLAKVAADAMEAAESSSIRLCWQESTDEGRKGYFRLLAQVPLTEATFDQLFNGNAGYRAQYYLSPEEGVLFNREVLEALEPAIVETYNKEPMAAPLDQVRSSLLAPHAKIWVFNELQAFDQAKQDALNPPRWVEHNASRGRRAPLPAHLMVDVKGAFINFALGDLYVFDMKLDRPCDLFLRGYS